MLKLVGKSENWNGFVFEGREDEALYKSCDNGATSSHIPDRNLDNRILKKYRIFITKSNLKKLGIKKYFVCMTEGRNILGKLLKYQYLAKIHPVFTFYY